VGRDEEAARAADEQARFQSTRPRGARRGVKQSGIYFGQVSIHAPAWGATTKPFERIGLVLGFNPRARVGRDQREVRLGIAGAGVSIHAPAWGATNYLIDALKDRVVSIHAPAWGATQPGKIDVPQG